MFTHLPVDRQLVCLQFDAIMDKAAMNIQGQVWTFKKFFLDKCLGVILNYKASVMFYFVRSYQATFRMDLPYFHYHQQCVKSSICSVPFSALGIVSFFKFSHFCGYIIVPYSDFNMHFPDD